MNLLMIINWFLIICIYAESENLFGVIQKSYDQCQKIHSPIKCFKVQALKIADRALQLASVKMTESLSIVRTGNDSSPSFSDDLSRQEKNLEKLNSAEVDDFLVNKTNRFLSTHRVQVNIPRLLEESRKKGEKNYMGPFLAVLAIKGLFMSVAYKGIALMSGAAILIGKMALLLSALLGLKKLVNGGHEQTTVEIVKLPHYSSSHTHAVSHEDEGHHYRNIGSAEEMMMQEKVYNNPYRARAV